MCLSFIPGRLYTPARLSSQVYNINTKAADSRSETGDTNNSTRKISPLDYFVLGKNSPASRTNTHLQTSRQFQGVDKMQTRTGGLANSRTGGRENSKISLLSLQAFGEMVVHVFFKGSN